MHIGWNLENQQLNLHLIYVYQIKSQIIFVSEKEHPCVTPILSAGQCLIKNHLFIAQ